MVMVPPAALIIVVVIPACLSITNGSFFFSITSQVAQAGYDVNVLACLMPGRRATD